MSTDKGPLAQDHGASLFHHSKDEARRNKAGTPHHQPGLAREHEKQQLPETPWARTDPQAPARSTALGGAAQPGLPAAGTDSVRGGIKHGQGRLLRIDASKGPLVEAGKSLYAPEAAPVKREVRVNGNVHDRHTPLSKRVRSGERPASALQREHRAADARKSGAQKAADAVDHARPKGKASHPQAGPSSARTAKPSIGNAVDYGNESLNGY